MTEDITKEAAVAAESLLFDNQFAFGSLARGPRRRSKALPAIKSMESEAA